MNRFSRIRHHVNMEDVKEKHSQTLAAKEIEEEHKKRLQEVFEKQKHRWRDDIFEGMTTAAVTTSTEVPEEDPIASLDASLEASFQGADNFIFVGDTTGENAFNGTRIRASGSGSGNSGGFNVGGSYLAFDQVGTSGGSTGSRHAILKPIDCTNVDTLTITAIVGDDSNGGSPPNNPNQVGNESLGIMYHHTNMRFHQAIGFLPPVPGKPDDGRPAGFSLSQSLTAGDIIPVGGSKGPGLHQYSIAIPEYARSKATQFSINMVNSSGTFDNIGITDIKFERKAPMNVIIPLDDPEGLSFVRAGVDQTERNNKQKRKKRVDSILKGTRNYTKKAFGPEFPGSDGKIFETEVPEKPILDQQQINRDQTADNISQQFTDNQIAEVIKKLGDPPEEVSSDPKDYDLTGLTPDAIKLGHFDPKYPVNPEGGYVAKLIAAKEALSAAMEAEFNRSVYTRESPNYNNPEIQKLYAAKQESQKELEGWEVFKANNNWRYLGPDIGAEPEALEDTSGMSAEQREKVIAELDKDIAKFSAEEQAAYDEMKRIALEFGMDVVSLVGGLFTGGASYAAPSLSKLLAKAGLKLLRKLGKNKLGKAVRKVLRKMKKGKNEKDIDDMVNDAIDADLLKDDGIGPRPVPNKPNKDLPDGMEYNWNPTGGSDGRGQWEVRDIPSTTPKPNIPPKPTKKLPDGFEWKWNPGDESTGGKGKWTAFGNFKTPKTKLPAGEVGTIDPVTKQPRGGGGADIGLPDINPSKPKVKLNKDGKVILPDIPELKKKPFKESTLLERLKSKGFFNPDDIKPVFPEKPPEELDPKTRMHPKYGKRSARYKRLDPMSANSMPPTGDPETDALVDKQRTKPKSAVVKSIFKKYSKKS